MLKIDSNTTGLRSAANTGISGSVPRTLVAVLSRDPGADDQQAVVAFGNQSAPRAMYELTDRAFGNCFGNNDDDLSISPVLPPAAANVYMMEATAADIITGWRSGGVPSKVSKVLGGDWVTVDTPICLGYRPHTHRTTFRGQIGEVLLFDRLLSERERADVEDYLVNKWTRADGADGLLTARCSMSPPVPRLTWAARVPASPSPAVARWRTARSARASSSARRYDARSASLR